MAIVARKVVLEGVQDASGMARLIDDGVFAADEVIAVIGKTEGNGGVNDFTRILADQAFRGVLMERGSRDRAEVEEIPMVWSGGCDGVITPHATVFARTPERGGDEPRLAVGIAMSAPILP
ncbi:MAG TPA: ring-opening amidohydrolase, partial [Euzebyales bacterium]|nr:ring-opening amidohydrolase [Euzebyales bacterium]